MTNYNTYSERKLQGELNATRTAISKLQSEKAKLDKKIEKTTQKENAIKQALMQRLTPNDETAYALKNAKSLPEYTSHEQLLRDVMAEIEAEKE
ncbi:hypothetical protein [Helicobacter labetoulli]|uniref:hypothetical protein n=1 Tax=Helicobacter labetoulli TaxID=2315333 RepID=UPI000EF65E34|nr:hypothetical protein [Helicobacter labetoulli]